MSRALISWTLAGCLALTAGCVGADAPQPEPANEQEESSDPFGGKGDIYGDDDREEYYESFDPLLKDVADATAVMVRPFRVEDTDQDGVKRLEDDLFSEEKNLCDSEPYRDQRAPGFCTGFLVAPDVMATAAHCIDDQADCLNTRFVFEFRKDSADDDASLVKSSDIYSCETLLAREHDDANGIDVGTDWALVRLDRAPARTPVSFRETGELAEDNMVALVGHPSGLPQKIAGGGRVFDVSEDVYFKSDLDSYGGNSGSPVVNFITGIVEGVHVRGTSDFEETDAGCSVSRVCDEVGDDGCGGNSAVRISRLRDYIAPPADSAGWFDYESQAVTDSQYTDPQHADTEGSQLESSIAVFDDGVVDFVTVDIDTDGELPVGAYVYIERSDGLLADLTDEYRGRQSLQGAIAVAELNDTLLEADWTLRIIGEQGVELPEVEGWKLSIHVQ
jgi:V8-like Glu-specific endopeptidase